MTVGHVAVISSENDLFIVGDSNRGAWEYVLWNGLIDEGVQSGPVEGNSEGQEEQEWYFPHDIINLSV